MNKQNDEFRLEPTNPTEGYIPKEFDYVDTDEYEYFKVDVEKRMSSAVYIKI